MRAILEQLRRQAEANGTRVCVTDPDGRRWTCAGVAAEVDAIADRLRARVGASAPSASNPVIALQVPSGGALWAWCLASVSVGCDALLLPEQPHARLLERVQRELEPLLTVTPAGAAAMRERAPAPAHRSAADAMGGIVLVSSGTTGFSRFIRRHPRAVDLIAAGLVEAGLYRPGDVVGSFLPMNHAYGFEHAFIAPLLAGASVVQGGGFSLPAAEAMFGAGATCLPLVPALLSALAEAHAELPPHSLRSIVSAGAPLGDALRARVRASLGVEPVDLYGATELGTVWLDSGAGGVPMPGVAVRVVDMDASRQLAEVAPGAVGEIAVESATRFDRVLGQASGTDDFAGTFFLTGDIGVRDATGALRIVGRRKLIFDVGGLKVNPFEVEAALQEHPAVHAALVEPVEAAQEVLRVAAQVELRPAAAGSGAQAPGAGELRQFLRGRVPEYAIPRTIQIVPALPRTPSGKILRRAPASAPSGAALRASRAAKARALFDASALGYDASSGAAFLGTGRWYRRAMLRRAGLAPGMSLLDVGSGTGLCAWLAQREVGPSGRVVALDPSSRMLEQARARGVRETVVGHAERLPFADGSFDMVSMSYMLRHVEGMLAAFREARRVLRKGGRVVIFEVTKPDGPVAGHAFRAAMGLVLPSLGVVASGRLSTFPMMRYWAETINSAAPPRDILQALCDAGFRGTRHVRQLGVFSCYRGSVV